MLETLMTISGILGTILVIGVYCLMQQDRIDPKGFWFSALNVLGSLMLLASISYNFDRTNIGALLVEVSWLGISAYGLWRALRHKTSFRTGLRSIFVHNAMENHVNKLRYATLGAGLKQSLYEGTR